jgi:hypothetical protein
MIRMRMGHDDARRARVFPKPLCCRALYEMRRARQPDINQRPLAIPAARGAEINKVHDH